MLHLWDVVTGKEIRCLTEHLGQINSLSFSPDGRLLASGSADTTTLIWDMADLVNRPLTPIDLPLEKLERLWRDLASADAVRAHAAVWSLVAARQTIPWLRERLRPSSPADPARLATLLSNLDSDTFAVRDKANRQLEELGELAESALRKTLAGAPSPEMRRRVEKLLSKLPRLPAREQLQPLRALEVLEHIASSDARRLLQFLATGVPEAPLTREAKESLERLAKQTQKIALAAPGNFATSPQS
jgi:hypothetical protein